MTLTAGILVAVLFVVTVLALWAYFTAQRLNTLHVRTDSALQQLEAALNRRAAVAAALIDDVVDAAQSSEAIALTHFNLEERAAAERALSSAIASSGSADLAPVVDAEARVQLAHRFYNEAVADTRALRLRPAVKLCRLGGTAPLPDFFSYVVR